MKRHTTDPSPAAARKARFDRWMEQGELFGEPSSSSGTAHADRGSVCECFVDDLPVDRLAVKAVPVPDPDPAPVVPVRRRAPAARRWHVPVAPTAVRSHRTAAEKMATVAKFMDANGVLDGGRMEPERFSLPSRAFAPVLRLWKGTSESGQYPVTQ